MQRKAREATGGIARGVGRQDLLRAAQRVVVLATGAATEAVRTIPRDGFDMMQ